MQDDASATDTPASRLPVWFRSGVVGVLLTVTLTAAASTSAPPGRAAASVAVTVSRSNVRGCPPVAAGFVGLATEYWDVEKEVGAQPRSPDTAFEQLARNLAPDGGLDLRIGGDSTDWTWWPVPGMKQPAWVRWTMTPTWAAVTKRLADDLRGASDRRDQHGG